MPDFNMWLSDTSGRVENAETRATRAWNRIYDKPTTITIRRPGVSDFTRVVRIEYFQGQAMRGESNPMGMIGKQTIIIFGVESHPDPNVPDTDLRLGDRFIFDYREFVIQSVLSTLGEQQAQAEATT